MSEPKTNKYLASLLKTTRILFAGFVCNLLADFVYLVMKHTTFFPATFKLKGIHAILKANIQLMKFEIYYLMLTGILTLSLILFFSIRRKLPVILILVGTLGYVAIWWFVHGYCYQWMNRLIVSGG